MNSLKRLISLNRIYYIKKSVYTLLLIFSICFLFACSENGTTEDIYLTVSPSVVTIPSEGGSGEFIVSSNTSWTITTDRPDIWISPISGTGDREVKVSIGRSQSAKQTEERLVIKSKDGSIVRNVSIQQEGILISGAILAVTNHGNILPFSGNVGDIDSLMILSNIPWQIKGPEWIEAYNGNRWVALSPNRATVQGGADAGEGNSTTKLLLRTAKQNQEEESLEDKIILSPTYDDLDMQSEIKVMQLGKHFVAPNNTIILASEIATDWKCGSDVECFVYLLSDHLLSDDEMSTEAISSWSYSLPDYVNGWSDLKEETMYYIYAFGIDKDNKYVASTITGFSTQTSKDQPLAAIKDVSLSNSIWSWNIVKNNFCNGYTLWKTTNTDWFNYSTGILAWFLNDMMHDETQMSDFKYYSSDIKDSWETPYHILLLTWGWGTNTNKTSNILDRYCSKDYYESETRSFDKSSTIKSHAVKKDVFAFRNNIVRIK